MENTINPTMEDNGNVNISDEVIAVIASLAASEVKGVAGMCGGLGGGIVELLGGELLIHSDFAGAEIIAKVSTNVLIKPHTDVELAFNKDKILIFDDNCGDRI